MTRRQAARITGAAALGAAAGTLAPLVGEARAASGQVPFGIIGLGVRGRYLLSHLNQIDAGRCRALCDIEEGSLRKAAAAARFAPRAHRDYREVLARKDIAAVLVATPPHTHFPIVRDALQAGKHVFCETPLVVRPEQVRELGELAGRTGQVLQVGFQRRYSQFYQTAKQMVSKGLLGEVTHIQAQWHRNPGWTMKPNVPRERNWRLFREFSGGLTGDLTSHQIDAAGWMFADSPEMVTGMGGLTLRRDGRDVFDNIALIFGYPGGQKLMLSAISTNKHLPMFAGSRSEFGEMILGTEGTIEITLGTDEEPAAGLWFYEPSPVRVSTAAAAQEIARIAGASSASVGRSSRGLPILLKRDQFSGDESFLQREMKHARRWLYSKGIMVTREDRNAIDNELESFFESCTSDKRPRAGAETGLENATAVILANLAMDETRLVRFSEFDAPGRKPGASKHR